VNKPLHAAKAAKNDEFYTRIEDVQTEIQAYLDVDPNLFRNKTILLPADSERSAFTQYFTAMGESLGVKKVINSTADFRSPEVRALRDEADFIITNPPFSLMREFIQWIMESGKKFIFIAPVTTFTYKELTPYILGDEFWWGAGRGSMTFTLPTGESQKLGNCCWLTNLPHSKMPKPMNLRPAAELLRNNKHLQHLTDFERYVNYDAIEIPKLECIPSDYDGVMGVPITFLSKWCRDQFELVGFRYGNDGKDLKTNTKYLFYRVLIRRKA